MHLIIRPANSTDTEAILQLAKSFAASFAVEELRFRTTLAVLLADSSACLRVAESSGSVVGYVLGFDHFTFFANGRVAWVEEIMVSESLRQRGIGGKPMEAFAEWARHRQCKLIALATRRAEAFYRAIGYNESATYFRKLL